MKDALGHGSNSRGGSQDNSEPLDLGRAASHIAQPNVNGGKFMPNPNYDPSYSADQADSQAAASLSQGAPPSKAGPAPVHPGASGPQYSRDAVNKAIASSNRSGRRIGGKEARAIHALLKGRH